MPEVWRPDWARGLTKATDLRVAQMAASKTGRPNWARGLNAASDPRIAKNVASRLGKPRGPYRLPPRMGAPIIWSRGLAYVVGLIATDGCLTRQRTIDLTSKDREQIVTFLRCLGRTNKIAEVIRHDPPRRYYRVQVGDRALYQWLQAIGVGPRKSLTLGGIDVPDEFALDLVRGLLDGDGSVTTYFYEVPGGTRPYEALCTSFCSASKDHIEWLRGLLDRVLAIRGSIQTKTAISERWHDVMSLRYAKGESITLLTRLYDGSESMRLDRKWRIWSDYLERQHPADDVRDQAAAYRPGLPTLTRRG